MIISIFTSHADSRHKVKKEHVKYNRDY